MFNRAREIISDLYIIYGLLEWFSGVTENVSAGYHMGPLK